MKKESIYLDTSVVSAHYDVREPLKQRLTRDFWAILSQFEVHLSTIVWRELEQVQDEAMRGDLIGLIKDLNILEIREQDESLSEDYIREGAIPRRFENDSLQIAVASTNAIDYFVSWNFRHIVKVKTRRMVNLINLRNGYKMLEIITPAEI